jgi:8-oxo-dGTP pyrophosphatase MutT (NUDIX family)
MPTSVSRKQYRMMMAIAHGKYDAKKAGGRGAPPKEVAEKYTNPGKDAPEQSGENRGGSWTNKHHSTHHKKESQKHGGKETEKGKEHRKKAAAHLSEHRKSNKELKKAFEDHYNGHAAAVIVLNDNNQILLGRHQTGKLAFAGGHMDVADGDKSITALRELKEEMGITGRNPQKVWSGKLNGNECDVFLIESFTGEPKSTSEIKNPKWFDVQDIPWDDLRDCCHKPLEAFVREKLGKSLCGMLALEKLEKNIVRQKADAVFEVTHGDALKLVGNGLFRKLREEVKSMGDEDFKDVHIDTYTISIRKHMNDVYSGRVVDGHKMVYQFTNKSLPELTAALMSVFEWYLPEDEEVLNIVSDEALSDDAVQGGVQSLIENYRRHNIGNIYQEMETIREHIRNGTAVDLQQVEARIMKLFDKLEETIHNVTDKHNHLAEMAGAEIDELERKLKDLQSKVEDMGKGPETVTAISSIKSNPTRIHDENYPYLPRPQIEISPNGSIKITFGSDWTDLEKQNFLHDMRAKVTKREKKNG